MQQALRVMRLHVPVWIHLMPHMWSGRAGGGPRVLPITINADAGCNLKIARSTNASATSICATGVSLSMSEQETLGDDAFALLLGHLEADERGRYPSAMSRERLV